jgi:hypothetical protein
MAIPLKRGRQALTCGGCLCRSQDDTAGTPPALKLWRFPSLQRALSGEVNQGYIIQITSIEKRR